MMNPQTLSDNFGRTIDYLRISVTDRCDFRCVYCMPARMRFSPRSHVLSIEEILRLGRIFTDLGVRKIRITGGEPLVREGIDQLCLGLSRMNKLRELVLTTNGSRLQQWAKPLADSGVQRLNISLDSLKPARFRAMTRVGNLADVLRGIEAAQQAGFERIKLNSVVMKGWNDDEVLDLVQFAVNEGLDLSFIEEMPMGAIEGNRVVRQISNEAIRQIIATRYTLIDSLEHSGGPSRYVRTAQHPTLRIGFISPHSNPFCAQCNRVRLTATGRLLLCLAHEQSIDLRQKLRTLGQSDSLIQTAIKDAMQLKPRSHLFSSGEEVVSWRTMNATGG